MLDFVSDDSSIKEINMRMLGFCDPAEVDPPSPDPVDAFDMDELDDLRDQRQ